MNIWYRMITLFVAAAIVTWPLATAVGATAVNSQAIMKLTPMKEKAPNKSASNISSSSPGYVASLLNEPLHLQNVDQAHDFYYQVPNADVGANNYIELVWSQSDLLIQTKSTLTILVDNNPLKSVFLNGEQNQIKIPLGKEHVSPGYHKLTVWKHSVVSDDLCNDQYNPANWVKIEPTSIVFVDTKETWTTADPLRGFPHPFVERGTMDEVYGAIVLPDSPSTELIASALELSTHLSSLTASKTFLPVMTETEWMKADIPPHAIALGNLASWTGPIRQAVENHRIDAKNEELILQYFSISAGKPNEERQMLLVTALKDPIIQDKIQVLTDETLAKQLTGTRAVVRETPKPTAMNTDTRKLTFASAGYDHLLLNEVNSHSATLSLSIPPYWKITGESWLDLKLKVSPLLASENSKAEGKSRNHVQSGLTMTINGIPKTISLEELKQTTPEADTYSLRIPLEPYLPGKGESRTFQITFSTNIGEVGGPCYRERNDGRWIFIDRESGFEIPYEVAREVSFKYWPAPFVNEKGMEKTSFLVPQKVDGKFLTQLAMVANELVSMTSNEQRMTILREPLGPEAKAALNTHNIIVLGDLAQYPTLETKRNDLLIPVNRDQWQLSDYSVINEMTAYAAWIQPSVWNKTYALAVFQSTTNQEQAKGEFVHRRLLSFLKNEDKESQIAVMSKSGEVFFIDVKEDQTVVASGMAKESVVQENQAVSIPIWLWLLISGVFLVVLYVFVQLWRKEKKEY